MSSPRKGQGQAPKATLQFQYSVWDSPMAWSCVVPLWLWLDSALDEAVAMSYTTVGTLQNRTDK